MRKIYPFIIFGILIIGVGAFSLRFFNEPRVIGPKEGKESTDDSLSFISKDSHTLPPFTYTTENKNSPETKSDSFKAVVPEEIEKITSSFIWQPTKEKPNVLLQKKETLTVPVLEDAEITFALDGAKTPQSYAEYFVEHRSEIQYDITLLNSIPKDAYGVITLPEDLIDNAITAKDIASIHDSLLRYSAFFEAKIQYEKRIPTAPSFAAFSKAVIGIDMLTRSLIDQAFSVEQGKSSFEDLKKYRDAYVATITATRDSFALGSNEKATKFFAWLKSFFGPPVYAAGLTNGFGGLITVIQECTCLGGYIMYLEPGYAPTGPSVYPIFISYATMASPLFYLNKSAVPDFWILGNYVLTPGPCLSAALCFPDGVFTGVVTMAGTS